MTMRSFLRCFVILSVFLAGVLPSRAQTRSADSVKPDYPKIYGYALQADIPSALALLKYDPIKKISAKDSMTIYNFEQRFSFDKDKSGYLEAHTSRIDSLLVLYRDYWRTSLKSPSGNFDTAFYQGLSNFLSAQYQLKSPPAGLPEDTIDVYLKKYILSAGYHTTGFSKTGRLFDLLVWKSETDTTYEFVVIKEKIKAPVKFLTGFVTLGWEDYATLGVAFPGGWTTPEAIYCVKESYDLTSESFLVDLLAHEGRHFSDRSRFPKLSGADLEYRAKLVQLILRKASVYQLVGFFMNEANGQDPENAHPFADYCLLRDMSQLLFHKSTESDLNKWKAVPFKKINETAQTLLELNTAALTKISNPVRYIRN